MATNGSTLFRSQCLANHGSLQLSRIHFKGSRVLHLAALYLMDDASNEGWGALCQGGGHLPIHFNAARVVCWSLYSKSPFDMEFGGEVKSVYYVIGSLQSQFVLGFRLLVFV